MSAPRAKPSTDDGFTLIELIVSALLLVVVISVVGGLFISTLSTQATVTTVTTATQRGQLVTDSIENGIRNAAVGSVAPYSLTSPAGTDQMLVARTAGNGSSLNWNCSAWYYSASTKSIRFMSSATAVSAPSSSALATWTLLSTGVTPSAGTSIFSLSGPSLSFAFRQIAGSSYVSFTSTISSRTGVTGSSPCF